MGLDYASLREQGLRDLERLSGGLWTDFNAHDPGITILEALCYALTDLGYRAGFTVPDLLASAGRDSFESLFPPSQILSCRPVTITDLRKLLMDVDGVRNAWVEPDATELPLHFDPESNQIDQVATPPVSQPVTIQGLSRVLLELEPWADSVSVRHQAARRLRANRPMCQDFTAVTALDAQNVRIDAAIEIERVADPESVLVGVFDAIAAYLSPAVPFLTLGEMVARGYRLDEIYDGPLLSNGFLETGALEAVERRTSVRASDLIRVVMDVPGVRAVGRIAMSTPPGSPQTWLLPLGTNTSPRLDPEGSHVILQRAGIAASVDVDAVLRRHQDAAVEGSQADEPALVPPRGRDRYVGHYSSVQRHLPPVFGLGERGLPGSALPERRAQARQLQAYLLFFDQLLADQFAQLANVGRLFSPTEDDPRTYFSQVVDEPELDGLIRPVPEADPDEGQPEVATDERRQRFLDHLLARVGEELGDYALVAPADTERPDALRIAKQAFLSHYPQVSAGRGTAHDLVAEDGLDCSGLEARIRLKLGLEPRPGRPPGDAPLEESLLIIEHILLRPTRDDAAQSVPLLTNARERDPYSLQLTVAFCRVGRFAGTGAGAASAEARAASHSGAEAFRAFATRTVRDEVPAHLTVHVRWLEPGDWQALETAYRDWIERRRELDGAGVAPS